MRFHVRLQRRRLNESPLAHRTLQRPLAGVRHFVVFARLRLAKRFAAVRARVLLDAAMHDVRVPLEVGRPREDRVAQGAREIQVRIVESHVRSQLVHRGFAQAARRTHEILDALVAHHVVPEPLAVDELLDAALELAFERLVGGVRVHVLLEVGVVFEYLAALLAYSGRHLQPAAHVHAEQVQSKTLLRPNVRD